MHSADELAELFRAFPGVGPRQAKRFVFHLLGPGKASAARIASLITELEKRIGSCDDCQRYFPRERGERLCKECRDEHRDHSLLAVVTRDSDQEAIEKSSTFRGYYFVLGGTIPVLGTEPEKRVRLTALTALIKKKLARGLKEIILATDANPEGDYTAEFLTERLRPLVAERGVTISTLGRGLSTGTELEYADTDTIKSALANRTTPSVKHS